LRALALIAASLGLASAIALEPYVIPPFSAAQPGADLPPGWQLLTVAHRKPPEFRLVRDAGQIVLRVYADAAVGSLAHSFSAPPGEAAMLSWRWKVERVLEKARLGTREGDDFAARVYVSFDVPMESLTFTARAKIKLAQIIYGAHVPAAAICYVWDNRSPVGTSIWNPYTDRLRMVVLESGNTRAGEWVLEKRDVDADFQAAFGAQWGKPTPRITGVAVAADTDQTGETATAWFGDLRLEARP
jgi:DUF3047 family protein